MTEDRSKTIAEIQEECRELAAMVGDPEVARILLRLANDLEQHARHPGRNKRLN